MAAPCPGRGSECGARGVHSWRATLPRVACAAALAAVAGTLQGCFEDGTCMWNGDIMVKGCRYNWPFNWDSCIEHCNGCFSECNKLKCAAYCAKASGNGDCLSNYQTLCTSAIQNVDRVGLCDVDCSAAKPRSGSSLSLAHLAPALVTIFAMLEVGSSESAGGAPASPAGRRRWPSWAAASAALLVAACCLSGCCHDPAPQLPQWTPDSDAFNRLADRVDQSGVWRGTGFQKDPPGYIESEQYKCVNRSAPKGGFCGAWHKQESNCHESEFGKCICAEGSDSKHFCKRWHCKDLEADQYICHYPMHCTSTDHGRRRHHRRLGAQQVDAEEYAEEGLEEEVLGNGSIDGAAVVAAGQGASAEVAETEAEARRLGHECHRTKECFPSPFQMTEQVYQLMESQNIKFDQLDGGLRMWAVIMHDSSLMGWLQTQSLCLTPGDFEGNYEQQYQSQMKYCRGQRYFREIEEEGSSCDCLTVSHDKKRCDKWKCVEHKNGLFGVLFERPPSNLEDLVDGLEIEHYRCESHEEGPCMEWSGEMRSWKQAEMGRCKCSTSDCSSWYCDEYKVLVTQGWYYYVGSWILLIMAMGATLCGCVAPFLFSAAWLPAGGALALLLVLLYLTWHGLGLWGFLFIGSPFALGAIALLVGALVANAAGSNAIAPKGGEEGGLLTNDS